MAIDFDELRGHISNMYSDVARFPRAEFHFPTGRSLMEELGCPTETLDDIPDGAMESFAGVGYHFDLQPIKAGEHVLDIGSGAGSDVFFAALAAGSDGSATGLDMTDRMLDKSRKNAEDGGFGNATFEKGLAETLPFDDERFDAVTSNGVINLTPSKPEAFAAICRVLKPGGRLMFSDIVTGVELPDSVRENCELWAECIGGAVQEQRYLALIEQAGMKVETVRHNERYKFTKESTLNAAEKFQVRSISILAHRT